MMDLSTLASATKSSKKYFFNISVGYLMALLGICGAQYFSSSFFVMSHGMTRIFSLSGICIL
jgi:hypothetical protein